MVLLKAVMYGDPEAYMSLVDRYIDLITRTAFRILCDREDSEAVTVKVFESLWYDVLDYDDRISLRVWLLRRTWIYSRLRIMRRRLLRVLGTTCARIIIFTVNKRCIYRNGPTPENSI